MSYSITNANGVPLVTIQDKILDNTTSLTLFGNNTPNFGQAINQNFVDLLQNWASPYAPVNPTTGQMWYDTSTTVMKIYNDSVWTIASQPINLSASNIPFKLNFGNNPSLIATISDNFITAVTSTITIPNGFLPSYVTFNNNSYLFSSLFPNGITPGITLAVNSNSIIGSVSNANQFTNISNIVLVGSATGNVLFDGSSDVNLQVGFANVYVGNTTVYGNWSNVTVTDSGQIAYAGNISANDVIEALGYVPYSSANISAYLSNGTVISRDSLGNFTANIMVGIAANTQTLSTDSYILLTGDVVGVSNNISDGANIIIQSNVALSQTNPAGIYNTIDVSASGIIQDGQFVDNMPVGSIVLYTQTYIPNGWAVCNGQNVLLPNGYTVTTPNLSNAVVGFVNAASYESSIIVNDQNVYIPNSNITIEVVWTTTIGASYIIHLYENMTIPSGNANIGVPTINLTSGNVQQIELIGGANIVYPPLNYYSNIHTNPNPQTGISEIIVYNNNETANFGNNLFYEAVALLLSSGDTNAVMMCATDIFGDLSQLVVQQVLFNLQNRHRQGLPPRLGKFMLSQQDIIDYIGILELPIDTTFFTIALQDELMLLKVSDITNRYVSANIFPDNSKLFGAVYIGYGQYNAVLRAASTELVGSALVSAGFDSTGDSYTDNLTCYQFITAIETLISDAVNIVTQNKTAITVTTSLNTITKRKHKVPTSLIQQPPSIIGNIYTGSNVTLITVDGLSNYYGGNINVNTAPSFGGGAFPYTSIKSSTEYFTILAQSRYVNPILSKRANGSLKVAMTNGIGIDIGSNVDVSIGNLYSLSGQVNVVVGPIGSPQRSQETLQNKLITESLINQQASSMTVINSNISNLNSNKTTVQTITTTTATNTASNTTVSNVDGGVFSGPSILPGGATIGIGGGAGGNSGPVIL